MLRWKAHLEQKNEITKREKKKKMENKISKQNQYTHSNANCEGGPIDENQHNLPRSFFISFCPKKLNKIK